MGVWTATTWRSKRRYQAKKEVMKADVEDFSRMGADVVSHREADTEGAIRSHVYELGRRKYHQAEEAIIVTAEAIGHL